MLRAWLEARQTETIKQCVYTVERIIHTELLLEYTLRIFATQRTDAAVNVGGPGRKTFDKTLLLVGIQLGLRSAALAWGDRLDAPIAIRIIRITTESCA